MEFVRSGYQFLGLIGTAGSPCCATKNTPTNTAWYGPFNAERGVPKMPVFKSAPGVFMEELIGMLKIEGINPPIFETWDAVEVPGEDPAVVAKLIVASAK